MTLGELIAQLAAEDPAKPVSVGFGEPHSYRGDYSELAFDPELDTTVGAMLERARSAAGKTFEGWKGGDFTMTESTDVWLAPNGHVGETIGEVLLSYMLGQPRLPDEWIKELRWIKEFNARDRQSARSIREMAPPAPSPRWPSDAASPFGAGWHWKGPGNWHEHYDAEHRHKDGDLPHLHKKFPPEVRA